MVNLSQMSGREFERFREYSLIHFAESWPSADIARQEFEKLLPQGLDTPNQHLLSIVEHETVVGFLWITAIERNTGREAFVLDLAVFPEYRRQGYAQKALPALEKYTAALGLGTISLSVFDHNTAAKALYKKAGFAPTFIRMTKKLGEPVLPVEDQRL